MEKLNESALAMSSAVVAALAYIVCLIFVAALPLGAIVTIGNYMSHGIDIAKIAAKNVTIWSFFVGTIGWFIIAYIVAYALALLYNKIAK